MDGGAGDRRALKGDLLRRLGFDPGFRVGLSGESLPDLFAHRLLTPGAWFADDARGCDWDVLELKRLYATAGHEVVAWRLLDLPTPCVITVVENDHVHRRRSNAWRIHRHYSRPNANVSASSTVSPGRASFPPTVGPCRDGRYTGRTGNARSCAAWRRTIE